MLDSVPNLVDYLYSNRKGSVLKDAVLRQPTEFVAPEFTTWRDEQRAWREGIAFYDQSFHMTTTYLRGPDAQKLAVQPGRQQLRDLRRRAVPSHRHVQSRGRT